LGYLNILLPHPAQRSFHLVNIPRKLHYQFPDFIRRYLSPENIAGNIEIFSQSIGNGHVHVLRRKSQDDSFTHSGLSLLVCPLSSYRFAVVVILYSQLGFLWMILLSVPPNRKIILLAYRFMGNLAGYTCASGKAA
jgi:hypothetical protein